MADKSAAILTIKDASEMTPEGREEIAKWLNNIAGQFIEYGDQSAGTFRARYMYVESNPKEAV